MGENDIYTIRPAGRHLITIGKDLIQDEFAALVELVKNAYDADSEDVIISFLSNQNRDRLDIIVEDHGHGMSKEDVIDKWLVPSTSYKVKNRKSPGGRIMQGRKGIGRYAVSILGEELYLETTDKLGNTTTLLVNWRDFEKAEYLDQVPIQVKSVNIGKTPGTKLVIHGAEEYLEEWDERQLRKLRFELKKLIPPKVVNTFDEKFSIIMKFDNFYENQKELIVEDIKPYPILELYDYQITGTIESDGKGELQYNNNKIRNAASEKIECDFGCTCCGKLIVDIRVYDRDKDAIEQLIARGLKDEKTNEYVSGLQARQLLNEVNGIGVYRNGFRIRPLGDSDFDWLKLNEKRIQNPSMKIGSNQVVGYVHIQSEEISHLEEKSARDGLKDNLAYQRLKELTELVIVELEKRRFMYRRKIGLSNPVKKIENELEGLYNYEPLKKNISNSLTKAGMDDKIVAEIEAIINNEQRKKNESIEEIRKAVAVYQGQATLGKIVNIILHEGRRPLNYFTNQIPNLNFYAEDFEKQPDDGNISKIIELTEGIGENAEIFVNLFGRLDPLAAKKRETKKNLILEDIIGGVVSVFENELIKEDININIVSDKDVSLVGWRQDIYTIFTNLIDNSIYWIHEKKSDMKEIKIVISADDGTWYVDYQDTGPGIEADLLESGVIFEPEFTTKPGGMGLGLSIAGEAAQRNGLQLIALQSGEGAHFRLIQK
jgi:C4-dicarboxylate-specific signal transduction histidine kinase